MDYKWTALTVTTVGAFMAALDSSCMTIGLPSVLIDLDATIFHGIWVITGYRLMLTILLVLLGFIVALAIIPRLLRGKTTPKQAQPERPPSSPTYMKN
jgi:MFS family permease